MNPILARICAGPHRKRGVALKGGYTFNTGPINSTTWLVGKPANANAGDYLVVMLSVNATTSNTISNAGFTLIGHVICSVDSASLDVWGKVLDGTENTSISGTMTSPSAFNNWSVIAQLFVGVDKTTPTANYTAITVGSGVKDPTLTVPSITTATDLAMQLLLVASDPTVANGAAPSYATPAAFTFVTDIVSPRQVVDTYFAYAQRPTAGATGSTTMKITTPASAGYAGMTFILRPR